PSRGHPLFLPQRTSTMKRNIIFAIGFAITLVAIATFTLDPHMAHTALSYLSGPDGMILAPVAAAALPDRVNAALREVDQNISGQIRAYRDKTEERAAELGARLQAVEQLVVKGQTEGGY